MSTGSRVREVRKHRGLTLERFGRILGVSKTAVSKIERDENALTDTMARLIGHEFGVSESWLKSGEGEMEVSSKDRVLDDLVMTYDLDENGRIFIEQYVKLDREHRKALESYILALASALRKSETACGEGELEDTDKMT